MIGGVPQTGTAIIIIVAFLLPGFVTVLLQERTFKSADDPTPLDRLLRIVWYSVWSYVLVAVAAIIFQVRRSDVVAWYHAYTPDPAQLVWRAALLIVIPAIVIEEATRFWHRSPARTSVLENLHVNARHSEPTAWDDFFRQRRRGAYLRITFGDGSRVLGYYGGRSFAAYAKDGRDLYLERVYLQDDVGWFGTEAPGNSGVWVQTADAVSVEVYNPDDGGEKAKSTAATTAATTTATAVVAIAAAVAWARKARRPPSPEARGQPTPAPSSTAEAERL